MKDMFYNYENNIDCNYYTDVPFYSKKQRLENCTCVKPLLNAKGEEIGIQAKENSKFYVYFNFDLSNTNVDLSLVTAENLFFEILDFKREIIAGPDSFKVELSDYANYARVEISTSATGPLKYGVYRMHLYLKNKDEIFTLFSPESGIFSIE